jgi:hypothetical protein
MELKDALREAKATTGPGLRAPPVQEKVWRESVRFPGVALGMRSVKKQRQEQPGGKV